MQHNRQGEDRLHETALRLLSRRAHGTQELAKKLLARGHKQDDINVECQRLLAVGLLDDLAFSQNYIHSRANKGFGPTRITSELITKGVSKGMVNKAMDNCGIDWAALGHKVIQKKRFSTSASERQAIAKRVQFLRYRGFGGIDIALPDIQKTQHAKQ